MLKKVFLFSLFIFLSPSISNAQIIISEIMYDPDGSDSGREWVEIWNNGNEPVDLSGWKLFENDTNHKINPVVEAGDLVIPAGNYGVIVDNLEKFNIDYPDFSGIVFDSTFSLKNTGEILIIKDGDLNEINNVNYNTELGVSGNSLQLVGGSWIAASPTPGEANSSSSGQTEPAVNDSVVDTSSAGGSSSVSDEILMQKHITANAGNDKSVVVGADTLFKGIALGLEGEPLKNARYRWSFGDGGTKEGMSVLHNYQYPGEYVVVMNASSGGYADNDRIIVKALPADIIISLVDDEDGFVELLNRSGYELDLSWWKIKSGENFFTFPENTIILSNKKLTLPSKITNLNFLDINQTYLLYPNGEIVNHYNPINSYNSDYVEPVVVKSTSNYIPTPNIEVEVETEKEYQTASVNEAVKDKTDKDFLNKWTFSLGGIILFSIGGVLLAGKLNDGAEESGDDHLKPEDFKIIE